MRKFLIALSFMLALAACGGSPESSPPPEQDTSAMSDPVSHGGAEYEVVTDSREALVFRQSGWECIVPDRDASATRCIHDSELDDEPTSAPSPVPYESPSEEF